MLANNAKKIKGIVKLAALEILRRIHVLGYVHEVSCMGTEH